MGVRSQNILTDLADFIPHSFMRRHPCAAGDVSPTGCRSSSFGESGAVLSGLVVGASADITIRDSGIETRVEADRAMPFTDIRVAEKPPVKDGS